MIYNESKFNTEWDTLPLSKLGEFKRGKSKHRPRNDQKLFEGGTYPLIQTGEIKAANLLIKSHNAAYNEEGLKQSKMWPAGTLAITIAANIAETGILAYPMCFPDSCVGFNADTEKTTELFMHYVFTYIKRSIQNSAVGSIQDNINIEMLTALNFKIPKKPIQDLIVDLLSAIDYKIELNNDINNEVENLAKTIYNYWFVQFDFPNENGKPYKTSGGEMEWNDELKREIPKNWEAKSIFNELDVQYGYPFNTEFFTEEETEKPVVRIRDLLENTFSAFTTEDVEEKYALKECDLLIGMDGNFHMNFWARNEGYLNQRTVRLRENNASAVSIFQAYFDLMPFIKSIEKRKTKTTVAHLSDQDLKELYVVVPKENSNFKPSELFNKHLNQLILKRKETQELIKLRDFLLPMLMNGQVKVKSEVNEQLSMAAEPQAAYKKSRT